MYIKAVLIQGFKSYIDQQFPDEFSPKHNCIIGKNGSGKSNFFFAIKFVLSDEYASYRPEERKKLLFEGPGMRPMSAFVEIVFDNTDGRLMVDGGDTDEVRIRRTIGLKKDEFRVNNRTQSASEVQQLLESAGFSASNPYYIVEQGKVMAITTMSDSQRLGLLKEVAGTRVYEDRRTESVKLLEESDHKKTKIQEAIQQLDDRLSELQGEKDELAKYKDLDRTKRAIEYSIYNRNLETARSALEEAENDKVEGNALTVKLSAQVEAAHKAIKEQEKQLETLGEESGDGVREKDALEAERQALEKKTNSLRLTVNEKEIQVAKETKQKVALEKELKEVEAGISKETKAVEVLKHDLGKAKFAANITQDNLTKSEVRLNELQAKKGRASQFKTQSDRDKYIEKEIKAQEADVAKMKSQLDSMEKQLKDSQKKSGTSKADIAKLEASIKEKGDKLASLNKSILELTMKRDSHNSARRTLWKKHSDMDKEIRTLREEKEKLDRKLEKTMSRDIKQGLNAVEKVVAKHGIKGVHGPLIQLLEADPVYYTAIEVTAGNALTNIVVDNDSVATDILNHINKEHLEGRVTFMPLNRLRQDLKELPSNDDVVPLVEKLRFKKAHAPAFYEVFGRTLLASSLETANSFSKSSGVDCVTPDGDQVSRKGALTGGYQDDRHSRIQALDDQKAAAKKWEAKVQAKEGLAKELKDLDQGINAVVAEMQKEEAAIDDLKRDIDNGRLEIRGLAETENMSSRQLDEKLKSKEILEQSTKEIKAITESLKAELGTEMKSQLTNKEEEELVNLIKNHADLRQKNVDSSNAIREIEANINIKSNELDVNLTKRRNQIQDTISNFTTLDEDGDRKRSKAELASMETRLQELEKRIGDINSASESTIMERQTIKDSIETLRKQEAAFTKKLQDEKQKLDSYLNEKSINQAKRDEALKAIRNLGAMPADLEKYQALDTKKLLDMLHKTNSKLEGYAHVNKKALDQFTQMSEKWEELTNRKQELDEERKSIEKLITHLDAKKDELLLRTFKQVKLEFDRIFKMLVKLQDDSVSAELSMSMVNGVTIKANFGHGGVVSNMTRLSGGQKTLLALTLIFAIQRCDPAPFYILDEIDAALDPQVRSAVAAMIRGQSSDSQYICTTFKPELVNVADRHYGVFHNRTSSRLQRINQTQALDILKEVEAEQSKSKKRQRGE